MVILIGRSLDYAPLEEWLSAHGVPFVLCGLLFAAGLPFFLHRWPQTAQLLRESRPPVVRLRMHLGLIFGCIVGYFAAHFLQMPDIRFFPPLILTLIVLFSVETSALVFSGCGFDTKVFMALAAAFLGMLFVIFGANNSDGWFRYNNRGYEYQPAHGDFIRANRYLETAYGKRFANPLNAPRVAYEKCDEYGHFGGDRVFESLPVFSGRQTMEGIHFASSLASDFVAFVQTIYSRDIKTPKASIFSRMNPTVLPAYLDLYNISQLVLATDTAKKAMAASPMFEKEAAFGILSIYRYTGSRDNYVEVPDVMPVVYTGADWLNDFHRFFKAYEKNRPLMIPEGYLHDDADRQVFVNRMDTLDGSDGPDPVRLANTNARVATQIDHLGIRFTTNKVGLPHLIKVSYFPNWQVKGANGVYPVSPHLMMVVPRQTEVVLTYGFSPWEHFGWGLTLITWVGLILCGMFSAVGKTRLDALWPGSVPMVETAIRFGILRMVQPLDRVFTRVRPFFLVLVLGGSIYLIVGGAVFRNQPVRAYIRGNQAYMHGVRLLEANRPDEARIDFQRAVDTMAPIVERKGDHQDVIHCMLFSAMALEHLDQWEKAEALYRDILEKHPYSRFVSEANVKIGRLKNRDRDRLFSRGREKLSDGQTVAGTGDIRAALAQSRNALSYFHAAVLADTYSLWAQYAKKDIENEREYWRTRQPAIARMTDDPLVLRDLYQVLDDTPGTIWQVPQT